MKPILQLALDLYDTNEALQMCEMTHEYVDILEVGTILIISKGTEPIRLVKEKYSYKTILADTKCTDAGKKVGDLCKNAGANIMTCSAAAGVETMIQAKTSVGEIWIEMFGNIDEGDYQKWLNIGIDTLIYHKSKDDVEKGAGWSKEDILKVEKLINKGFKVCITGGLTPSNIEDFKDLKIHSIIVGSSILNAKSPKEKAKEFRNAIDRNWNC